MTHFLLISGQNIAMRGSDLIQYCIKCDNETYYTCNNSQNLIKRNAKLDHNRIGDAG